MFDAFLNDLAGFSGSVEDFFSKGIEATMPSGAKIMSGIGESRLLESGWASGSEAGMGRGILESLAGGFASSDKDKKSISMNEGMITGSPRAVGARATTAKPSVDASEMERDWINRLQRFANISNTQVRGSK